MPDLYALASSYWAIKSASRSLSRMRSTAYGLLARSMIVASSFVLGIASLDPQGRLMHEYR
jgi:hypothetical protein